MESSNERLEKRIEQGIETLLEEKELKLRWKKEMEETPSIVEYLKGFNQYSVNSFIESYVSDKYMWVRYGDMYRDNLEREREKWIVMAHEHLENILQKKLFDMQCLWRANQLKIEGIEIGYDFLIVGQKILECHFIEPITAAEVAMYQAFLLKGDANLSQWSCEPDWQDYEEIKEAYNSNNSDYNFPEWYDYHNMQTGKSALLLLPNSRGDAEDFYISNYHRAAQEKREVVQKQGNTPVPIPDTRPYLSTTNKEQISFYVNTFEERELQLKYKYYTEANQSRWGVDDYIHEIFMEMMDSKEPIPIKEHFNFKEALQAAHQQHKSIKIAEHLPLAHQQYLFHLKMDFSTQKKTFYDETRAIIFNQILDGRVLNGEDRDLNF